MIVSPPPPNVALPTEKGLVIVSGHFPAKAQRRKGKPEIEPKLYFATLRLCGENFLLLSEYTLDLVQK